MKASYFFFAAAILFTSSVTAQQTDSLRAKRIQDSLNNIKAKLEKQIREQNSKNTETITNISDELLSLRKEVELLKANSR